MAWLVIFIILAATITVTFAILNHSNKSYYESRNKTLTEDSSLDLTSYETRRREEKKKELDDYFNERTELFRKIKTISYLVLLGLFLIVGVVTSVFVTNEQQVAFTLTLGKTSVIEEPGIHFKIPFISKKYKFDSTTKGMSIGYDEESNESIGADSLMITSDFNFVNIDFYVEYRITDAVEYQFGSKNPEEILKNVTQASIRNTVGLYNVDSVITTGKAEIQNKVKEDIIEKLEGHHTGITIVNVTIQDAEPPTKEVEAAFKSVETAKQNADTAVNEAKTYENKKLPAANADADEIVKKAEAAKTERINQATQEVAEFNALFKEYKKNPETVKRQLYFQTMSEILPGMKIIFGDDVKIVSVDGVATTSASTSTTTSTSTQSEGGNQ